MTNTELLESFDFACKVKNLTPASHKCYAERLTYLVRFADSIGKELDALTQKDIQTYIMSIIDVVSAETVNGRIRVYRTFFRHLLEEGLISEDPMARIKMLRAEKKVKQVLSVEEVGQVLSTFKRRTYNGSRDYCMVLLTYDSMLRLNEMLGIKIGDIDLTHKMVKVHGKGRKERMVPFSDRTAKALHTHLIKRKDIPGDFLFPAKDGNRLKTRRAHRIFCLAGRKVDVYVHPHLLRHSGATEWCRKGGSPAILQRILGHSSLAITQRYLHLNNEDVSAAYESFSPVAGLGV